MRELLKSFRVPAAFVGAALCVYGATSLTGCANDSDPIPVISTTLAPSTLVQIDRMGNPATTAVFVPRSPVDQRDSFNLGDPSTDVANFRATLIARVNQIRAAVNAVPGFPPENSGVTAEACIDVFLPDALVLDFSRPTVFPNGRSFADDTIDFQVGLLVNRGNPLGGGPGVSDGVANDSTFSNTFPFLGPPQDI